VLRILRYYRFEARFGSETGDTQARAACKAAAPLLPKLSAERVAQEVVNLLESLDPVPALRMMQEDGILAVILPEAHRLDRLRELIALNPKRDALHRLAAVMDVDAAGADIVAERLRFSTASRERLRGLAPPLPLDPKGDTLAQRRALYRLGPDRYRDVLLLLAAERAMTRERLSILLDFARSWTPPAFPITGRDVTALGIPPGPRVGRLLEAVHVWWEEGDFVSDRAACLAYLKAIAAVSAP